MLGVCGCRRQMRICSHAQPCCSSSARHACAIALSSTRTYLSVILIEVCPICSDCRLRRSDLRSPVSSATTKIGFNARKTANRRRVVSLSGFGPNPKRLGVLKCSLSKGCASPRRVATSARNPVSSSNAARKARRSSSFNSNSGSGTSSKVVLSVRGETGMWRVGAGKMETFTNAHGFD